MTSFQAGVATDLGMATVPVQRILGRNPGPMTGPGTNSYLIGRQRLCLIDPGPANREQLASFVQIIADRELVYILATHTHGDHSPGALALQEATGAELVGMIAAPGPAHDASFKPIRSWRGGESIQCEHYTLELVHTPGHVHNHLCIYLREEKLLFTGDHVLQGTTSVILPPDGDMAAYLASLEMLRTRDLRQLAPGHGGLIDEPYRELEKLIAHRLRRERKVLDGVADLGPCDLERLVGRVYDAVDPAMYPWAKKTMLAHLIKLQQEGQVVADGSNWSRC
ncbi:MAG: MBL fold metallo-hydrolase [Gammaproteobacteria bacterium]